VGKLEVDLNAVLRVIEDIPVQAGETEEVSPVSLNPQSQQASGPQCELALRLKEAHDLDSYWCFNLRCASEVTSWQLVAVDAAFKPYQQLPSNHDI
jgi:hypothetical protein